MLFLCLLEVKDTKEVEPRIVVSELQESPTTEEQMETVSQRVTSWPQLNGSPLALVTLNHMKRNQATYFWFGKKNLTSQSSARFEAIT